MKKVLFFILLLWCPFSIVSAQFVNFGQDRPSCAGSKSKPTIFKLYTRIFSKKTPKKQLLFSVFYTTMPTHCNYTPKRYPSSCMPTEVFPMGM